MRKKLNTLDATPPKDIYRSIIADYDLRLGLCELIDNAIDIWYRNGKQNSLMIEIDIDTTRQSIIVKDNAGGISEDEIVLFMSPGRTSNTGHEESIGIFGVGSKRALVAIAENIKVLSRRGIEKTIEVKIDENWLREETWHFEVFHVDDIQKNSTIIELFNLRLPIRAEDIDLIVEHLATTYGYYLSDNLSIILNNQPIRPVFFDDDWAYPPDYMPKTTKLDLPIKSKIVHVEITAGLLKESSNAENGVYFYCNNRLISKANRSFEVGYSKGKAGLPNHPSAALARIIVKLNGEAQFMPWNSSKSGINFKHYVFEALRDEIINIVTMYVSLSRRLQGEWPEKVFAFKEGEIKKEGVKTLAEIRKIYAIPLPKIRVKISDQIKSKNKELAKEKPWTVGLYESIIAVDTIMKQNLDQKNRFALILLDSTLEIAFKEYLANECHDIGAGRLTSILSNRAETFKEIRTRIPYISADKISKINYYYKMRCNLVHQAASSNVSDDDVSNYREVVQAILGTMFNIKF